MPIGATGTALIGAGAQLASSAFNIGAGANMNRKNRKFAEKMANQSRQWALDDWKMQNEYNNPSAQMERLKAAGLNPNLVYGNGASTEAGPVRSTEAASFQGEAPKVQFDAGSVMGSYFDTKLKQGQLNQQSQTVKNMQAAEQLTQAQILQTLGNTDATKFDLSQRIRLADTQASITENSLRKLQADTQYTLDENERAALRNVQSLSEGVERIAQIKAQTANTREERERIRASVKDIKESAIFKHYQNKLWEQGINPNSPQWQSMLIQALQELIGGSPVSRIKQAKELNKKGFGFKLSPLGVIPSYKSQN